MKQINRRRFLTSSLTVGTAMALNPVLQLKALTANASRKSILKDKTKCINCQLCVNACQKLYGLMPEYSYLEVKPFESEGITYRKRISCMHCEDAACVKACPTGTLYKGNTGFTYVAREKCIGCKYCLQVCPYKIIKMQNGRVNKCVGCEKLVEKGEEPRCVNVCPVGALHYGSWQEMLQKGKELLANIKRPYPEAVVYGEKQLGGLGLIFVLGNKPQLYDLPVYPSNSFMLDWWKNIIHPGGLAVTGLIAFIGLAAFGVAKRNYAKEQDPSEGGVENHE